MPVMATACESAVNFEEFDFDSVTTTKNFIDKGAFGDVYGPFTWNGRKCVLKRNWISSDNGDDYRKKVEDKRNIWISMKHKNLIEIYSVMLRPKALYFVMDYASGGSLRRALGNSGVTINRPIDVSNWAKQLAEGMQYLHEKSVIHRDLKSSNIMLMEPFDGVNVHKTMTLKITDFDEVREFDRTATMSLRGTCAYAAPEVLELQRFSKASDVWSYGVVLWEMFTRELPHKDMQERAIILKAQSGQLALSIPKSIPKGYKELLRECLQKKKKRRPTFCEIINQLNSIKNAEAEVRYKLDPVLVQMISTKAAEEKMKSIRVLTILDKELFVVSEMSSEVEIYDLMKFSFCRGWLLKELVHPHDMGSCSRNKCLYIFDCKGSYGQPSEILRVDPNGKLIKNWSTGVDYGWGLSVTDELNVVLTVFNKNKLDEYSPNGQLIREINLSSDTGIHHPLHAVKLTSGHFVVSHGIGDDDLHRVCVVDGDGKLEKSFGGICGTTIGQMNLPAYLVVDENGFVVVVDRWNSRVLLLDSDLKFKREILSKEKHGLQCPHRILLDQTNCRLFVVDKEQWSSKNKMYRDEGILIFEFR